MLVHSSGVPIVTSRQWWQTWENTTSSGIRCRTRLLPVGRTSEAMAPRISGGKTDAMDIWKSRLQRLVFDRLVSIHASFGSRTGICFDYIIVHYLNK